LRAGQQSLLDTLLPRLALVVPAPPARIDLAQAFGGTLPADGVWLEVGFGAGEHLVWQAEQHPGVGLIGCEPYLNGVAKCLAHIERSGVGNVRLFTDDARLVMAALPERSLGRVFVLFPDPWLQTLPYLCLLLFLFESELLFLRLGTDGGDDGGIQG
jgi:tRNA (guanine-N7-)-methyltransferase